MKIIFRFSPVIRSSTKQVEVEMVQRIISNSLFTRFIITFRTSKSSELTLFVVSWANRSPVRDFFPPVNSAAAGCAWRAEEIFSNKRDRGKRPFRKNCRYFISSFPYPLKEELPLIARSRVYRSDYASGIQTAENFRRGTGWNATRLATDPRRLDDI